MPGLLASAWTTGCILILAIIAGQQLHSITLYCRVDAEIDARALLSNSQNQQLAAASLNRSLFLGEQAFCYR